MSSFFTRMVLLFFLVAAVWDCRIIWYDLHHPEIWDQDWTHDPRWYMPVLAAIAAFGVWFIIHVWRWKRRLDRLTPDEQADEAMWRLSKGRYGRLHNGK
jgi:hypothetical protein